jgi:fructosamine-3-kinase
VTTCHGTLPQYVGWESSWEVMFSKIVSRAMDLDHEKHGNWPEFNAVRRLLFEHVIPRLLRPLQSEGRSIKPCLIHGDIWDENCADDMNTGEPFAFDAGSIYAHNEYEIGYWRPPRHRLSNRTYVRAYKKHFPVSEPGMSCQRLVRLKELMVLQRKIGTLGTCYIQSDSTSPAPFLFLQAHSAPRK